MKLQDEKYDLHLVMVTQMEPKMEYLQVCMKSNMVKQYALIIFSMDSPLEKDDVAVLLSANGLKISKKHVAGLKINKKYLDRLKINKKSLHTLSMFKS